MGAFTGLQGGGGLRVALLQAQEVALESQTFMTVTSHPPGPVVLCIPTNCSLSWTRWPSDSQELELVGRGSECLLNTSGLAWA